MNDSSMIWWIDLGRTLNKVRKQLMTLLGPIVAPLQNLITTTIIATQLLLESITIIVIVSAKINHCNHHYYTTSGKTHCDNNHYHATIVKTHCCTTNVEPIVA
jgi:hypothetical protein